MISVEKIETDKHERNSAIVVVELEDPSGFVMDYYGEICFYFSRFGEDGVTRMMALVHWTDREMWRPKRSMSSGLPYYTTSSTKTSKKKQGNDRSQLAEHWYDIIDADTIRRPVGIIQKAGKNFIVDKLVTVNNIV